MLPVFKLLLLWVLGVLILPYNPFSSIEIGVFLLVLGMLFLGFTYYSNPKFKRLESLLIAVIIVGSVHFLRLNIEGSLSSGLVNNSVTSVVLKVKERYKQTEYHNKYIVEVETLCGDSIRIIELDYLLMQNRIDTDSLFVPGDRFIAKVFCKTFQIQKHSSLFNTEKYWRLKNVKASLWLQDEQIVHLDRFTNLYYVIRALQIEWLDLIYTQNIGLESKQMLAALLLGDKRSVGEDISNKFSKLGLVHTLALSGLHISLVYGICALLLSFFLKHKPRLQSVLLLLIILMYAILTGLSPSVMRASLMFFLYAWSLLINRRTTAFNVVFLSALILLIYQPYLLYDIGFQLSYLAVIGIVYFYNKFKVYVESRSLVVKFFFGLAVVSISAQLSTGLLAIYYFHTFPVSFLWANIIVLPFITLLLYQGILYLVLLVLGLNFSVFDLIVNQSFDFLLMLITFLEKYSFAPASIYLSGIQTIQFYGLLILCCIVFLEGKFKYLKFLYAYTIVMSLYMLISVNPIKKELFINASSQAYVLSVIANNEQVVISNKHSSSSYLLGSYAMKNGIECVDSITINTIFKNEFCSLSDSRFLFFDKDLLFLSSEKLNADFRDTVSFVFMANFREDVETINQLFSPSIVLLNASISNKNRLKLLHQWEDLKVEVVDLRAAAYVHSY